MKLINYNIPCPSCQETMKIKRLHCEPCDVSVDGHFVAQDFGGLSSEEMHFLRIFVLSEGKIKDIEKALGVSYPTVKNHLAQLKAKFAQEAQVKPPPKKQSIKGIIGDLEDGKIDINQALEAINTKGEGNE